MTPSFSIVESLTEEDLSALKNIFSKSTHRFFHQDPEWLVLSPGKPPFLVARDDSLKVIGYAGLEIKPFKTIHISFGPLTEKENDSATFIGEMIKWLRKEGWWRLAVQLPIPSGKEADLLLKHLSETTSFRQSNRFFNWKSWWLPIEQEPDELLKSFSSHHQKSVKQGLKHTILYQQVTSSEKALELAELYIEMYKHRKLPVNEDQTRQLLIALNTYTQKHQKGLMLEAILDDQLVGGIVILFQGNHAYYYFGATTTKYKRSIPVLYTAFFHIIQHCRKAGLSTLDFGGFDPDAKPGDQLYNINRFKTGFGGTLVDYPGQMVFDLNPVMSRLVERGIFIRNSFRKWQHR